MGVFEKQHGAVCLVGIEPTRSSEGIPGSDGRNVETREVANTASLSRAAAYAAHRGLAGVVALAIATGTSDSFHSLSSSRDEGFVGTQSPLR